MELFNIDKECYISCDCCDPDKSEDFSVYLFYDKKYEKFNIVKREEFNFVITKIQKHYNVNLNKEI